MATSERILPNVYALGFLILIFLGRIAQRDQNCSVLYLFLTSNYRNLKEYPKQRDHYRYASHKLVIISMLPFCFIYSPYHYLLIFAGRFYKSLRHHIISSFKYFSMDEFISNKVEASGTVLSGYEKALFGEKQAMQFFN